MSQIYQPTKQTRKQRAKNELWITTVLPRSGISTEDWATEKSTLSISGYFTKEVGFCNYGLWK